MIFRRRAWLSLMIMVSSLCGIMLSAQEKIHIIAQGETLYAIARENGVSIQELEKVNKITDPTKVRIGQKIVIPSQDKTTIPNASVPKQGYVKKTYIVQHGDTLYSIAKNSGSEVAILLNDNRLRRESILKVGQKLTIRSKSTDLANSELAAKVPEISPNPIDAGSSSLGASELTGQVTNGTSFQKTIYTQGANLTWPHPGERYTLNGKLPWIVIKAQKGEIVKSVNTGKVIYTGPHKTFGHIVFVQSPDGFVYIYGGNENSDLKMGEIVHSGDIIGTVGVTPGLEEPQVYFSIWKDGTYMNPASVLHG